ncbi:hypothetical protein C8J25_11213 [Sphingomonas faeni]|uniref:Uncharacterized protein n=1 Tax=Sphingomonas faeni TaxID=185950 RepID=A0A2T5TXS7_9SPHN|nr:hypothetical protein [Sphingomonas faeni]PTW44070.1 hypothetical protein C8J25_11213 [Sphingomonas faeni]
MVTRYAVGVSPKYANYYVAWFLGDAEAINPELQAGAIARSPDRQLSPLHRDLHQETAAAVVNATTAISDRSVFLKAGGAQMPREIGVRTEMYCIAAPGNAGLLPSRTGTASIISIRSGQALESAAYEQAIKGDDDKVGEEKWKSTDDGSGTSETD